MGTVIPYVLPIVGYIPNYFSAKKRAELGSLIPAFPGHAEPGFELTGS
jgi:hypothetical protein